MGVLATRLCGPTGRSRSLELTVPQWSAGRRRQGRTSRDSLVGESARRLVASPPARRPPTRSHRVRSPINESSPSEGTRPTVPAVTTVWWAHLSPSLSRCRRHSGRHSNTHRRRRQRRNEGDAKPARGRRDSPGPALALCVLLAQPPASLVTVKRIGCW